MPKTKINPEQKEKLEGMRDEVNSHIASELEAMDFDEVMNKTKVDFSPLVRSLLKKMLKNNTDFEKFRSSLGLKGDHLPLERAYYYFKHSCIMPTFTIKVAKSTVDNRENILVRGDPGQGKGHLKNDLKKSASQWRKQYKEMHSVSNAQQLIGKMLNRGKITKKGYLGSDILIHDECQNVINEIKPEAEETNRLIRLACDTYGENEISKDLVDDKPDNYLSYTPHMRVMALMHPVRFTLKFFSTGTARRYSSVYTYNEPKTVNVQDFVTFDEQKNDEYSFDKPYIKNFELTKECFDIISVVCMVLLEILYRFPNDDVKRLAQLGKRTYIFKIIKKVMVAHSILGLKISEPKTTLGAAIEQLLLELQNVEEFCNNGDPHGSNSAWSDLDSQQISCVNYLYRKKATSVKDSTTSIKQFKDIIRRIYGVRVTQANEKYNTLKEKGYIASSQSGQYDSKVWLPKVPQEIILEKQNYNEWIQKVVQGFGAKIGVPIPSIESFVDEKGQLKTQGIEGIGFSGTPLNIIHTICVEPFICLFILIYIEGVVKFPNPSEPCENATLFTSRDSHFQGIGTLKNDPNPSNDTDSLFTDNLQSFFARSKDGLLHKVHIDDKFGKGTTDKLLSDGLLIQSPGGLVGLNK